MPALTLRPAPLDRAAALRALPAAVAAVVGGAWLALMVAAVFGASLDGGATVWIAVAGGCACVSGVMVGAGGSATGAAVLAVAAVGAVVIASAPQTDRAPASPVARAMKAPPPAAAPTVTAPQRAPSRPSARARARKMVRAYYADIAARDFTRAWARLSPAVQAAFGGFEVWRAGYATTLTHRVEDVQVSGNVIRHTLVATDRTPCGTATEQRFAVTWTLAGGHATALHAVKLAGQDPAAAC